MRKVLIFFIPIFLLFSCIPLLDCPDDPEEKPIVPFLIDSILLDDGKFLFMETPLIIKDMVILFPYDLETGEGWIRAYDKLTLEPLWTWQEALDEFGLNRFGFSFISHYDEGIICIKQNNLSYGIDAQTGQTIWNNIDVIGNFTLRGKDDIIGALDYFGDSLLSFKYAKTNEGAWQEFYSFGNFDNYKVEGGMPYPFSWNGVEYLTFVTMKFMHSPREFIMKLNLYNLTEEKMQWTSDTIPLNHPFSGLPGELPVFEDGQILLANDAIYSFNIEDGSLEWWKAYNKSFSSSYRYSSHITAANKTVFGNNDDNIFVGLDVHSGDQKFLTETGGTPSFIAYQDNKCFMADVSTSQSHVMVFDATTGEILEDVTAPFIDEDKDLFFDRVIAVDEETGFVYTSDHRHLLVYDFM